MALVRELVTISSLASISASTTFKGIRTLTSKKNKIFSLAKVIVFGAKAVGSVVKKNATTVKIALRSCSLFARGGKVDKRSC